MLHENVKYIREIHFTDQISAFISSCSFESMYLIVMQLFVVLVMGTITVISMLINAHVWRCGGVEQSFEQEF